MLATIFAAVVDVDLVGIHDDFFALGGDSVIVRVIDDLPDFTARIPLGRHGTPWEVGKAIAFLLSDDASFITGHELVVDGGMTTLM